MPPDRSRPGRSHAQIADHNSRTMLEALRRNGAMTRAELAALTGLTTAGVNNVIKRHIAGGLIAESGQRRAPNAQVPAAEYGLRPEGAFSIGVRARPDQIEGLLVDLSGQVHARAIGTTIAGTVERLLDQQPAANLIGIGVARAEMAGSIADEFPDALVIEELDTVAAAVCERTYGGDIPENGIVIILLEERIRSCLLLHARPFAGVHGRAGRIGEMHTGHDRRRLDDVCSLRAFRAIADDDPVAVDAWVQTAAEHLLDAVTAVAGFVAPGRIVLAGGLPLAVIESLIAAMQQRWASQTPESPPPALPPIAPAARVGDSVTLGAALLPFFETLLPKP